MNGKHPVIDNQPVIIPAKTCSLQARLSAPAQLDSLALILESASTKRRDIRHLGQALNRFGIASLSLDLLEGCDADNGVSPAWQHFNLPLLSNRLRHVIDWIEEEPSLTGLPIAIVASESAAAAALVCAARQPHRIQSLFLYDSRPDLAGSHLARVRAPILFAQGENDHATRHTLQRTISRLECSFRNAIFAGTGRLTSSKMAWQSLMELACNWLSVQSRHPPPPAPVCRNPLIMLGPQTSAREKLGYSGDIAR
jgi:putative phosphoribosyl transferase